MENTSIVTLLDERIAMMWAMMELPEEPAIAHFSDLFKSANIAAHTSLIQKCSDFMLKHIEESSESFKDLFTKQQDRMWSELNFARHIDLERCKKYLLLIVVAVHEVCVKAFNSRLSS